MPVQDFNSDHFLESFTHVINTAETTTAFWRTNSEFISLMIVFVILLVCGFAVLIIVIYFFKKSKELA